MHRSEVPWVCWRRKSCVRNLCVLTGHHDDGDVSFKSLYNFSKFEIELIFDWSFLYIFS
jgi:hypothetical protein